MELYTQSQALRQIKINLKAAIMELTTEGNEDEVLDILEATYGITTDVLPSPVQILNPPAKKPRVNRAQNRETFGKHKLSRAEIDQRNTEIYNLRKEGNTYREIAEAYNLSKQSIAQIVKRMKIREEQ